MAIDLPRLIAAIDKTLVQSLIERIARDRSDQIDWNLDGRDLGRAVQAAINSDRPAWGKLQQIGNLANHGTTATIRSVLYKYPRLRGEFDEQNYGPESAAAWLAGTDDELFEKCLSALHVDQGLNKRSWKAFRARTDLALTLSFAQERLAAFESLVRDAIRRCASFDKSGELETHHFSRTLFPEHTHSRRSLEQVTVYAEARFVAHDAFVDSRLKTEVSHKVDCISLIFDNERNELDIVTLGGQRFLEDVAAAFVESFTDQKPSLEPLIRRQINFDALRRKPNPDLIDQRRFVRAKVDEIRVLSPGGMLYTFDAKVHRNEDRDVYDVAKDDFGEGSPFERDGWRVVSARVVLFAVPSQSGRKPRPRTVELKMNGHTNLREQEDEDLYIADELLTRWGILAPSDGDETNG